MLLATLVAVLAGPAQSALMPGATLVVELPASEGPRKHTLEHALECDGTVYVWIEAVGAPVQYRVTWADQGWGRREQADAAVTFSFARELARGQRFELTLAPLGDAAASARVHYDVAEETPATLAVAAAGRECLREALGLEQLGAHDDALEVLRGWVAGLCQLEGAESSRRVVDVLWDISASAPFSRSTELRIDLWERVAAFGRCFLPDAHSDRQVAAENLAEVLYQTGRAIEARAILERVVARYEAVASQRPLEIATGRARVSLSLACAAAGDADSELAQLECAEDALADIGAPGRELRAQVREQLATRCGELGDYEAAEWYAQAAPVHRHGEAAVVERAHAALKAAASTEPGSSCGALQTSFDELAELAPAPPSRVAGLAETIATTLLRRGCEAAGIAALERAVELRSAAASPTSFDALVVRTNHAAALANAGEVARATESMQAIVAELDRTVAPADPQLLHCLQLLGELHARRGELDAALIGFQRCVDSRTGREPATAPALLAVRRRVWATLNRHRQFERAWTLAEEDLAALASATSHDDDALQELRTRVADVAFNSGRIARAIELEEQVVATLGRTHPDSDALRDARSALALTLLSTGDVRRSRELRASVHDALVALHGAHDPRTLAARVELAGAQLAEGDLISAIASVRDALEQLERAVSGDDARLCRARFWLALSLEALGDYAQARALFERVLASADVVVDATFDFTLVEANLARLLCVMGEPDAARELFERVERRYVATLHSDHRFVHVTRGCLAKLAYLRGDVAGARVLHERVLTDLRRTRDDSDADVINELDNYSATLRACGELARARELGEQVVTYAAKLPWSNDYYGQRARSNLGWTLAQLRDWPALAPIVDGLRGGLDVAALRASTGSLRELQELAVTSDVDLSTYLSLAAQLPDEAAEAPQVFASIERFRDLASAGAAWHAASGDSEARAKLDRVRELRAAVAGLVLAGGSPERESKQQVIALVGERDRLERELVEVARRGQAAPATAIDVESVARALPEGAAAAAYKRYARTQLDPAAPIGLMTVEALLAHVVTRDGRLVRVELGELAPIETAVADWRAAIGAPLASGSSAHRTVGSPSTAGRELRRLVFDPVLAAVGDAHTLHVCLDGPLHLAPLDALELDDGTLVGERRRILVELTLARLLDHAPRGASQARFLALGSPDFDALAAAPPAAIEAAAPLLATTRGGGLDSSWRPLPHTLAEVQALGALFQATFARDAELLCEREATKRALNARAPAATFVHIATHGYFAPPAIRSSADSRGARAWNPMDHGATVAGFAPMTLCGLVLAGANRGADELGRVPGVMTAEELATLDLSRCELAVLAACESNVGLQRSGQSMQSLQAALRIAGARTAITSSWIVDDAAARKLMLDFYERLWVRREPKAQALWAAKMQLHAARHPPVDWAGWVLTGDPH